MMWAGATLLWGLLIVGIIVLIRFSRRPQQDDRMSDVRSILDERLARGEIDPQEHQRILDLISSRQPRDRVT